MSAFRCDQTLPESQLLTPKGDVPNQASPYSSPKKCTIREIELPRILQKGEMGFCRAGSTAPRAGSSPHGDHDEAIKREHTEYIASMPQRHRPSDHGRRVVHRGCCGHGRGCPSE